jgi:alkylation response protein AidB-like acyl-CoA dehydrogenase
MMDSETGSSDEYRKEARNWLAKNTPRQPRPENGAAMCAFDREWMECQYEAGWAGLDWPKEYGGQGLARLQQAIWHEEYVGAGAPAMSIFRIGINHAGPTLASRGNPDQKARYLRPILQGAEVWCQGFSEPDAGSDLASLRTSGVVDGDEIIVNGSKIWTSFAQYAQFQELLIRTDRTKPKHHGLTWVICDMQLPGIDIRPIKTMDGGDHFCQVFYDNVRIPVQNVVGGIDDGWNVAMSTLTIERGMAFIAQRLELAKTVEAIIDLARERGLTADGYYAQQLADLRIHATALRAMAYVTIAKADYGGGIGPEATANRLVWAEQSQRAMRLAVEILGPEASAESTWVSAWLRSFAATIAGGTKDIQRNILGERLLGLPR